MNEELNRLIRLDKEFKENEFKLEVIYNTSIYVTHSGIAIKNFRIVPETIFTNIGKKRLKQLKKYAFYKYFTEKSIRTEGKALFIHHIWSSGYHHWVCDCLIKLNQLKTDEYTLYIPAEYPAFVFESLSLFTFKNIIKIPEKTGLKSKQITYVVNPPSGFFNKSMLLGLKNSLFKSLGITKNSGVHRVFLSRKNAGNRKILNEDKLIPILTKFNFQIIDAAEYKFADQVKLFAETDLLLSNHGAGLTNCLFMPPNSTVIEMYRTMNHDNDRMNLCYYRLAKELDLDYYCHFVEMDKKDSETDLDRRSVVIDILKFETFLYSIIEKK